MTDESKLTDEFLTTVSRLWDGTIVKLSGGKFTAWDPKTGTWGEPLRDDITFGELTDSEPLRESEIADLTSK